MDNNVVWIVKGQTESGDDYLRVYGYEPTYNEYKVYFREHWPDEFYEDGEDCTMNLPMSAVRYIVN